MPPLPEVVLTVGDVELSIDPDAGNRATSWRVGDLSLLAEHGSDPRERGMYPMGPWAGRLRDNAFDFRGRRHALPLTYAGWAMHGTIPTQPAEIIEHRQEADRAVLVARVVEHPGWPWATAIDIAWDLRPRVLTTSITVRPTDEQVPAVVGWHPWFARDLGRGRPLEWAMAAIARAERGSDYLPTGRLMPYDPADGPFDDAFLVPGGRALLRWPEALELEVASDGSWFVVFDQLSRTACIEPQSGPPNGLNDGLGDPVAVATPDQPVRLVTTWTMRDDPPAGRG